MYSVTAIRASINPPAPSPLIFGTLSSCTGKKGEGRTEKPSPLLTIGPMGLIRIPPRRLHSARALPCLRGAAPGSFLPLRSPPPWPLAPRPSCAGAVSFRPSLLSCSVRSPYTPSSLVLSHVFESLRLYLIPGKAFVGMNLDLVTKVRPHPQLVFEPCQDGVLLA